MFSYIINPNTNKKLNIQSLEGKEILNNYINYVSKQKGGSNIVLSNPAPIQELTCFKINLPTKSGPIVNYFNSWITDNKKVILECQILIEQVLLALWSRNKPLVEQSGKIIQSIKHFKTEIENLLNSLNQDNNNIIDTVNSIKNLISKLDEIIHDKKISEKQFIKNLILILDKLSNSKKVLDDARHSQSLQSKARLSEGLDPDTEVEGIKTKVLESKTELLKNLEKLNNLRNEFFVHFNNFLNKISQSSNRKKTTMLRNISFDNLRGLRVVRSGIKQIHLMGSNIIYSNQAQGGKPRKIQIEISIVNDYMLSAKLSSIESGRPIKLKISSNNPNLDNKAEITNEELKNIDGIILLSVPRSIVLTDISHNPNTQQIDTDTFMRNIELAVSTPTSDAFILELVKKLLTSRSRESNYKRFLDYILEAILTKRDRKEYYVHNIAPFFDVKNRKIVSYGDKNINKSFVLEISNFNKMNKGYSLRLRLHELIPKFKKGRGLEYYRSLPYYDFSKVLTEIASINLESVDGEFIPNYVFTGSVSFFDMCSIM